MARHSLFCIAKATAMPLGRGWYERSAFQTKSPTSHQSRDLQTLITAAHQTEDRADRPDKDQQDAGALLMKKRVYKKRKSTHLVRKEERQALEAQIQDLETTLEALKLRALVRSGGEDASLRTQTTQNTLLRDALQEQHLSVAKARAMLVGCAQRHSFSIRPMETYIHLTASHEDRRSSLLAIRGPKLQYARQFIESRSLGLLPTADYFSEERFETSEGDLCNVRFDRVPLRSVKGGVQAVFGALKQAIFNAEIILSESTGHITIREDDDMDDIDAVAQMKLVSRTPNGVVVENNLVHFSELVQAADDSESYALATADFVDQDDRFPYHPQERVRRDATSVILVTSHKDSNNLQKTTKHPTQSDGGHTSSEKDTCKPVTVITRWVFVRICHTELSIPSPILQEVRDRAGRVSETILNCVRETLGL